MNLAVRSLGRLSRLLALGAVLAAGVGAVGLPSPVNAQTAEQVVGQRRLEMRAARDAYVAAQSAFSVVERQFSAALDEVNLARRSGDDDRLERASAQAQDRSFSYRDQERRLVEVRENLTAARRALIEALSVRLEQLVSEMDAAASSQQRAQLNSIFRDHSAELQALEAEEGDTFRIDPVVLPDITFDPRDTPDELRAKAELLERKAVEADSVISSTERQIDALNDRLRRERQVRDMVASIDRFDDTRVPVVTGPPGSGRVTASDSTVAGARPLTLEERIQNLRDYAEQLASYRDQLLIRAAQFRRRVGAVA